MSLSVDVVVVGAGLSGLMAAVQSATRGLSVLVLDRNETVGGKYCYTSMGTAALTNTAMDIARFHGHDARFVSDAVAAFDAQALRGWFSDRNLELLNARHYGLVHPPSGADAVATLVQALVAGGGELRTETTVTAIARENGRFRVAATGTTEDEISARAVVLATGGANLPQLGGCEDGYALAAALGHRCEPAFPAHVGVTVAEDWPLTLPGLWMDVELQIRPGGRPVKGGGGNTTGSMLFTRAGLTGEAIFNISRYIEPNLARAVELHVNFHPGMDARDVAEWLHRVFGERAREPAEKAIDHILPRALGAALLARQKVKPGARVMQLDERQRQGLLTEMQDARLQVTGTLGMKAAESCAGGVRVREVDPRTLESRLVPGLHIVGRVLDVSADWGGFEQHFALASGFLAGRKLLQ